MSMNINRDIVYIANFSKKYGKDTILNIEEYSFYRGYSYLLVGGNGCGKSTLIKSILGFLRYDGIINVNTFSIAYLPERIQKTDFLSINEYFDLILSLNKNKSKIEYLEGYLKEFGLNGKMKITSLSKGMFQKVNIILTLILDRELIILDEPLNGLDNETQKKFINKINRERSRGKSIIISTHYPYTYNNVYDKIIRIENKTIHEVNSF